ncbi:MAG: citrate synthase [Planctomycetes bacterium]|nr:citrate synthase [Planctomycetota bacterium]
MPFDLVPGLEEVPIAESSVSFVDGTAGKLEYRGINVELLAANSTFEEVCFLLLFGKLPTRAELEEFQGELVHYRKVKYRIIDLLKCLPEKGHPMDALQAAVAAIGMFYPRRRALDDSARRAACLRIIAKIPTVVAAFERLSKGDDSFTPRTDLNLAGDFLYMMTGEEPDAEKVRILEVCLILHADHTMNASTFAGRVVGSTLADPYCVVSSALGALSGPLHGGANEEAIEMFKRVGKPENTRAVLQEMLAKKEKIPGFGHRVYKTVDPRSKILKVYAEKLTQRSGSPYYQIAVEIERLMQEQVGHKGVWPNVDFYSGIVYRELGIPTDCFTPVFAMARAPGWLAHWLEQLRNNRIFRPTQRYVGTHDQPYTPIDTRT